MRPRSRLLSKRRLLLPTIREGAEEAVKELNEANSLHTSAVSSEDYFLSICHLAHPTFPAREASPYGRPSLHADAADRISPSVGVAGLDPLEYLYGQRGHLSVESAKRAGGQSPLASPREGRPRARAHSIPHVSSPELQKRQRKSSFPDLRARSAASVPNISPERSLARLEAGRESRPAETPAKQSLISQWISDCRSAWRVARARACMLPAIAEV